MWGNLLSRDQVRFDLFVHAPVQLDWGRSFLRALSHGEFLAILKGVVGQADGGEAIDPGMLFGIDLLQLILMMIKYLC